MVRFCSRCFLVASIHRPTTTQIIVPIKIALNFHSWLNLARPRPRCSQKEKKSRSVVCRSRDGHSGDHRAAHNETHVLSNATWANRSFWKQYTNTKNWNCWETAVTTSFHVNSRRRYKYKKCNIVLGCNFYLIRYVTRHFSVYCLQSTLL